MLVDALNTPRDWLAESPRSDGRRTLDIGPIDIGLEAHHDSELSQPFTGLMMISSEPLRNALAPLGG
jgi:hypothetical protein